MNVSYKGLVSGLALTILSGGIAFAAATTPAAVKPAAAHALKYNGSGGETFTTTLFSYDDAAYGYSITYKGSDTFGAFTGQCVAEFVADGTCTAPDKTAGTEFDIVAADCAQMYANPTVQLFSHFAAQTGVECASDTTGSYTETSDGTFTGGTGRLAGTTGNFTSVQNGTALTTPSGPQLGAFGAGTFTITGTYTK
jgi:hypothetical protein